MAKFTPTPDERAALERLFTLAEGFGGGAARARSLLCAWWNASELGGFDFADLWSFNRDNVESQAPRPRLTLLRCSSRKPPA